MGDNEKDGTLFKERVHLNAISRFFPFDYKKRAELISAHGSWEKAWDILKKDAPRNADVQKEWECLSSLGISFVLPEELPYPNCLREISFPPLGIYVKGMLLPRGPAVAIVGTRRASDEGKSIAHALARDLAASGVSIVSGLAFGIDRAAHEGCLEGGGRTVAVLANGLDRVYPASHGGLAKRILKEGGALVSEYPLDTATLPYRFLERNRIISGLSLGVVIVEAPLISGAVATARFAMEQNRDVFVVPGPARSRNFEGSHKLIKEGAQLVTDASDVLAMLDIEVSAAAPAVHANATHTGEERIVLQALGEALSPLHVDKISEVTKLNTQAVIRTLTFLLVKDAIEETRRGYVVKARHR
jgi:DNA processing protein